MKFLIELEMAEGRDLSRERVAEVVAPVLEGSTANEALSTGLFEALHPDQGKIKDRYEDGACPICGEAIPDDHEEGGKCANCGLGWSQDDVPRIGSLRLLDPAPRVGVEHLTVYVDPARGEQRFCVDEDHADDEHGRRVPGEGSTRFASPDETVACVAEHLRMLNTSGPESQDNQGSASLRIVSTPPDLDSSEIEGHNYGLSIDGPSFREQRELLLQLVESSQQQAPLALSCEQGDLLDGLVNLTDAIADQAADRYGIDCLL